jgi:hypothetical protein
MSWSTSYRDIMRTRLRFATYVTQSTSGVRFRMVSLEDARCPFKEAPHPASSGAPYVDMYGQKLDPATLGSEVVQCVYCNRSIGVLRFAPHLERCMGMGGRLASRQAKRNLLGNAQPSGAVGVTQSGPTVQTSMLQKKGQTPSAPDIPSDPDEQIFDFYASIEYSSDDMETLDKSKHLLFTGCVSFMVL